MLFTDISCRNYDELFEDATWSETRLDGEVMKRKLKICLEKVEKRVINLSEQNNNHFTMLQSIMKAV